MTWQVVFTKQAQKDAKKLAAAGLKGKAIELLESLKIGAEDLLSTAVPFEAEAQMTTIDIKIPEWSLGNRG